MIHADTVPRILDDVHHGRRGQFPSGRSGGNVPICSTAIPRRSNFRPANCTYSPPADRPIPNACRRSTGLRVERTAGLESLVIEATRADAVGAYSDLPGQHRRDSQADPDLRGPVDWPAPPICGSGPRSTRRPPWVTSSSLEARVARSMRSTARIVDGWSTVVRRQPVAGTLRLLNPSPAFRWRRGPSGSGLRPN